MNECVYSEAATYNACFDDFTEVGLSPTKPSILHSDIYNEKLFTSLLQSNDDKLFLLQVSQTLLRIIRFLFNSFLLLRIQSVL